MFTSPSFKTWLIAFLPASIIVFLAAWQPFVPLDDLFRDPLEVAIDRAKTGDCCHAYFGLLTKLGALIWCAVASVCLFASSIFMRIRVFSLPGMFMFSASLVTAMLLFDDYFQGHEVVFVKLFGIDEVYVFALYGLIVATYLLFFKRMIIENGSLLLLAGLALFAVSMGVDVFIEHGGKFRRICEDGSKLLGIACWATFHIRAAWMLVSERSRAELNTE